MQTEDEPLVVKLGGSLFDNIQEIVSVLAESGRDILIVPGGGQFADSVRAVETDEDSAHWMAICAMEQVAWHIAGHGVLGIDSPHIPNGLAVLFPYRIMRETDPLPHSWDVTSDTIAAWVAKKTGAGLLLLKSVDGLRHDGILQKEVREPFASDEVDPFFLPFLLKNKMSAAVVNGSDTVLLRKYLSGAVPPGTLINPMF